MYLVLGEGGVPDPGGHLVWGVYLVLGGCVPGHGGVYLVWGPGNPPCGQTHTCKNIVFATSLRTVISEQHVTVLWGLLYGRSDGLY